MNFAKCDFCLNSRKIISENGYHSICTLSSKKSFDCISNKKNYYITLHPSNKKFDYIKDENIISEDIKF